MTTEQIRMKLKDTEKTIIKYNNALLFIKDLDFVHKSPKLFHSKLEELYQYLEEDTDNEYTEEIMQYMYDYYSGEFSMIQSTVPYREFIYLCEEFFNNKIKLCTQIQKICKYEISRRSDGIIVDTIYNSIGNKIYKPKLVNI